MDTIKAKLHQEYATEHCKDVAHKALLSSVSGNYPDQLKITKIYRSISFLSSLNTITEKLVYQFYPLPISPNV